MTLALNLPPEREAALKAQAQSRGLSIEQWLLKLVEQSLSMPLEAGQSTSDTWEDEFNEWMNSFSDTPALSDEAVSRASLHLDRW